ncbi:MAG: hypothetical protein LRY41_00560 [Candidatus Pacebacteria bacterium]|nr:hypothetical protein [Candidatus Paceibacterota bacterium]MCD8527819.1 hypothetical protein [Candidatus Paceibacterota bacterium]MCD8563525.1 hypothetical protein [Candidatus Paceibacterota bacterium]
MIDFLIQSKAVIIILHALAAGIAIGATVATDTLFFSFLKDFHISKKERQVFETLSKILWWSLFALIVTGVLIFFTDTARYMASTKFLTKMILVGIVTLNGLLLNWFITPHMNDLTFDTERDKEKNLTFVRRISFASGGLSITTWLVIFILGSVPRIPLSVGQAMLAYFGIILMVIAGTQFFDYRVRKAHQEIAE